MEVRTKNKIEYRIITLPNGRKVNYVHQGVGLPVVMVHGLAASLHDWDDLMPELAAAGYAGYALDLLGHGESEKPERAHDYSVENAYADFTAWINSLQIKMPMVLVGHSLGGGLSMLYARRNPDRVKALVIVNPFYSMGQLPPILQKMFRHQLINTTLIERTPSKLFFRLFVDVTSFSGYIGNRETHVLPEHIRYQTAFIQTRLFRYLQHSAHASSSGHGPFTHYPTDFAVVGRARPNACACFFRNWRVCCPTW